MATSATDERLFAQVQHLHTEANGLLFDGQLLATIQVAGPTLICGSYALGLMTRRDIDIYVQLANDQDIPRFFELGGAITRKYPVHKASFSNHFIRGLPGFDHGLYWGIQLKYDDQIWKLDLWGHGPIHFAEHCAEFAALQEKLASADRSAILRIKEALRLGDGYRNGITGMDIYSAVLTGAVTTVEQFDDWVAAIRGKHDRRQLP